MARLRKSRTKLMAQKKALHSQLERTLAWCEELRLQVSQPGGSVRTDPAAPPRSDPDLGDETNADPGAIASGVIGSGIKRVDNVGTGIFWASLNFWGGPIGSRFKPTGQNFGHHHGSLSFYCGMDSKKRLNTIKYC